MAPSYPEKRTALHGSDRRSAFVVKPSGIALTARLAAESDRQTGQARGAKRARRRPISLPRAPPREARGDPKWPRRRHRPLPSRPRGRGVGDQTGERRRPANRAADGGDRRRGAILFARTAPVCRVWAMRPITNRMPAPTSDRGKTRGAGGWRWHSNATPSQPARHHRRPGVPAGDRCAFRRARRPRPRPTVQPTNRRPPLPAPS